jgi:hypothetical protein
MKWKKILKNEKWGRHSDPSGRNIAIPSRGLSELFKKWGPQILQDFPSGFKTKDGLETNLSIEFMKGQPNTKYQKEKLFISFGDDIIEGDIQGAYDGVKEWAESNGFEVNEGSNYAMSLTKR